MPVGKRLISIPITDIIALVLISAITVISCIAENAFFSSSFIIIFNMLLKFINVDDHFLHELTLKWGHYTIKFINKWDISFL